MPAQSRTLCQATSRVHARALTVFVSFTALLLASCGGGGGGGGGQTPPPPAPPPPVNRAPVAANDVLRAEASALASINVLANDTDADGNPLTVTVEEQAAVGTVAVNADGTVRVDGLPSGFKGITRFRYRVADAGGLSSVASAAIFVGTDPFRVIFAGDAAANGSNEIYLADFISAPTLLSTATDGSLRLHSFVSSSNGGTVVYRRTSTGTPSTSDLSFVRAASPRQDVRVALPTGVTLVPDVQPADQYRVSDDGQWIVFIARDGLNADAAYVLNVTSPTTIRKAEITGTVRASLPRFSSNSQTLFLLASASAGGTNKDLYAVELSNLAVSLLSAPSAANSADDVLDYAVASDQGRILLRANRNGRVGLYFVNPSQLQTEVRVSQALGLTETILESTTSLVPGAGGSVLGQKVAYTVQSALTFSTWVADVSATPNPHLVATGGARVRGFRPDNASLLYARAGQIYEATLDGSVSDQLVGAGAAAWYDSTGNIVLLQQFLPSGGTPATYPALAAAVRGAFGATQPLGTPVLAAHFVDISGFDRAVAVIGEGPTTGAAPASARLAAVNAMAPDKLLYLSDFPSPLQLPSGAVQIVRAN
jgi:hypothetical protein